MFTNTFQASVWVVLVVTSLLLAISLVKREKVFLILLSIYSATLQKGVQPSMHKTSMYFIPLIISGIILENFYTGEMTSEIIKPAPDILIKDIFELKKLKHTLIFVTIIPRPM